MPCFAGPALDRMRRRLAAVCRLASGFSGECVRTGRCLRCDDSETDDRVDRNSCRALGVRSIVAVPIRPGSRVTGLLEVFSSQPFAFSPDDISVLRQLTGTIVSVIGDGAAAAVASPFLPKPSPAAVEAPRVAPRVEEKPAFCRNGGHHGGGERFSSSWFSKDVAGCCGGNFCSRLVVVSRAMVLEHGSGRLAAVSKPRIRKPQRQSPERYRQRSVT